MEEHFEQQGPSVPAAAGANAAGEGPIQASHEAVFSSR